MGEFLEVLILCELRELKERMDKLASGEAELNAALDTLSTDVQSLKTAVEALIEAIPPTVDLTDEIQRVRDSFASVEGVTQEVQDATPTPPPPPEG